MLRSPAQRSRHAASLEMLEPRLLLSAEPFGLAAGLVGVIDQVEEYASEAGPVSDSMISVDIGLEEEKGSEASQDNELFGWSDEVFGESENDALESVEPQAEPLAPESNAELTATGSETVNASEGPAAVKTVDAVWASPMVIEAKAASPEFSNKEAELSPIQPGAPPSFWQELNGHGHEGTVHEWIAGDGGSFADPASWSTGETPGEGDVVIINGLSEEAVVVFSIEGELTLSVLEMESGTFRIEQGTLIVSEYAELDRLEVDGSTFVFSGYDFSATDLILQNEAEVFLGSGGQSNFVVGPVGVIELSGGSYLEVSGNYSILGGRISLVESTLHVAGGYIDLVLGDRMMVDSSIVSVAPNADLLILPNAFYFGEYGDMPLELLGDIELIHHGEVVLIGESQLLGEGYILLDDLDLYLLEGSSFSTTGQGAVELYNVRLIAEEGFLNFGNRLNFFNVEVVGDLTLGQGVQLEISGHRTIHVSGDLTVLPEAMVGAVVNGYSDFKPMFVVGGAVIWLGDLFVNEDYYGGSLKHLEQFAIALFEDTANSIFAGEIIDGYDDPIIIDGGQQPPQPSGNAFFDGGINDNIFFVVAIIPEVHYETNYYVGPAGGDFNDPNNWSLERAPVNGDRVVIPYLGGTPLVLEQGSLHLHSLSSLTPLIFNDFDLNLSEASRFSGMEFIDSSPTFDGEFIYNLGDVVIHGGSQVLLDTMFGLYGTSAFRIVEGGAMVIASGQFQLNDRGSVLSVEPGGALRLIGGRLVNFDGSIIVDGGLLRVDAGSVDFYSQVIFRNEGQLLVGSGTVSFSSYDQSSAFESGSTLRFASGSEGRVNVYSDLTVSEDSDWLISNGGLLVIDRVLEIGTLFVDDGNIQVSNAWDPTVLNGNLHFLQPGNVLVEQSRFSSEDTRLHVNGDIFGAFNLEMIFSSFGSQVDPTRQYVPIEWTGRLLGTIAFMPTWVDDFFLHHRIESQRLVAGFDVFPVIADTNIWWQTQGGNFMDTAGWSLGRLPTAEDSVVIAPLSSGAQVSLQFAQQADFAALRVEGNLLVMGTGLNVTTGLLEVAPGASMVAQFSTIFAEAGSHIAGSILIDGTLYLTSTTETNTITSTGSITTTGFGSIQSTGGRIVNHGTIDLETGLISFNQVEFINHGTFVVDMEQGQVSDTSLQIVAGSVTFLGFTNLFDSTVEIGEGASLVSGDETGALYLVSSEVILDNGTLDYVGGTVTFDADSTLRGNGTILGNVLMGGVFTPGFSPGSIQIQGDLTVDEGSSLTLEAFSASSFDQINISGTLEIAGGTLTIVFDGYTPGPADTFTFLTYGSISGTFDSIVILPIEPEGFDLAFGPTGLVFSISAGTGAVGEALEAGYAAWLAQLPSLAGFFNLGTINFAALGLDALELPILPDVLNDMFGLSGLLSGLEAPDLSSSGTLSSLVEALLAAGFEVLSVEGGYSNGSTVIPDAPVGTIIEVRRETTFDDLDVLAGFAGDLLNTGNDTLAEGLAEDLDLSPLFTWLAELILDFVFGLDEDGFFILGSSALLLGITGSGAYNGSARVGSRDEVSVSGNIDFDQTVALRLLSGEARYRISDFTTSLDSMVTATADGSASLTLAGTAGPVEFDFGLDVSASTNLTTRTVDLTLTTSLEGALHLDGIVDEEGDPVALTFTGSYNSVENHWVLTVVLGDTLKIGGQEITGFELELILSAGAFTGSGTATIFFDTFNHLGAPLEVGVAFTFTESGFTLSGSVDLATIEIQSSEGETLFSGSELSATLLVGADFSGGGLTGGFSLSIGSAIFAPDAEGFSVAVNDSDDDGIALSGSFDFATQELNLTLDELVLSIPGILQLTAAGVSFRYDRRDEAPDQEYFRIESLEIELIALRNQSSLDPPVVTGAELVVRKDAILIGSASANLGNLEIEGILGFNSTTITFDAVQLNYASAPSGTITISSESGYLFEDTGLVHALITDSNEDGVAIGGSLSLATGAFSFELDQLSVYIGSVFRVDASSVLISYDPNGDEDQTLASVGSASVIAVGMDGLSVATINSLVLRGDGISLGSATIGLPGGETVTIGDAVELTGARVELVDFGYSFTTDEIEGTASLIIDGVSIFPGSTVVSLTATGLSAVYNFTTGEGDLEITIDSFRLEVGEALVITANDVVLTPGDETILTIASASISSPLLEDLDAGVITNFELTRSGFTIANAEIGTVGGQTVRIGDFIEFVDARIVVDSFSFNYGTGEFSGSVTLTVANIALFPETDAITLVTEGLVIGFDFTEGNGELTVVIDSFRLEVGEALVITANDVVLTPGDETILTIASASISSPLLEDLDAGVITNFELTRSGFTIASAEIGTVGGQTVRIGDFIEFVDARIVVDSFSFNYTTGDFSGSVTLTVANIALFPETDAITLVTEGLVIGFDFTEGNGELTVVIGTFRLEVGEAIAISANNVVLTPGNETILTIASASISSPLLEDLEAGVITDFELTRSGFTIASAEIGTVGGQTVRIGDFIEFVDARIVVDSFSFNYGTGEFSGSVTLTVANIALFPETDAITLVTEGLVIGFDFTEGNGELTVVIDSFRLEVGEALVITANDVVLTPGDETILTIASAAISSPLLEDLDAGVITNFELTRSGFTIASAEIGTVGGQTVRIGDFIEFVDARIVVDSFSFNYTTGDFSGSVTLTVANIALFPETDAITLVTEGLVIGFDFTEGNGELTVVIGTFRLEVGEAIAISANNVVLTPGDETILTIASATISSPLLEDLEAGTITNFELTRSGFSIASATIGTVGGQTVSFGDFLEFQEATIEVSNFTFNYETGTFTGSISLNVTNIALFPGSDFIEVETSGLNIVFDFGENGDGSLEISVTTFVLSIGEALRIEATNVSIAPTGDIITTIATASVTSPTLDGLVSASLEDLELTSEGFSLGSFTIGLAEGQDISLSDFVTLSGVRIEVSNFSYSFNDDSVAGSISVVVTNVLFFPGSDVIQSEMSDISASFDFSNEGAGSLTITVGSFSLLIGNALSINATEVVISPGSEVLASIATGSVSAPEFPALPTVSLEGLEITRTGFSLANFTITAGDPETEFHLGSVFTLRGISISASNVVYDATSDQVQGIISFNAAFAELLPGNTTFTTTVSGLAGSYDFDSAEQRGELVLTVTSLVIVFGDMLRIEGEDISVTPDRDVMIQVGTLSATIPALSVGATVSGLRITSVGGFSVTGVSVDTGGMAETIGIGNFLPFDIQSIEVVFADSGSEGRFSLEGFELGVTGSFNFDNFGSLPFTPIIQIGEDSFENGSNSFSFVLTVRDGMIAPKDLGPIRIGFSDLDIGGTVIFGGTIILGGYQDGEWVPTFGGTISLQTGGKISNFSGSVEVGILGSFDPETGVLDINASLTVSFEFQDLITVTDAQLGMNLTIATGEGFTFEVVNLELQSASIGLIRFSIGGVVTLEATDALLNFNPGEGENIAEIGSLSVTLDGLGGISGSAQNFGINADGEMIALPGFGVSLSVGSSGSLMWPDWLPIQITYLALVWNDFNADRLDFQIILSANVSSLNALPVNVEGVIQEVVIDVGLLRDGKFPIIDIGAFAISISGNLFGGEVSGALVLGIVKFDAEGNRITGTDTSEVDGRVLYGAIQAGFSFAGLAGFQIRIGISELGPLQVYLNADIPILLEPFTGLSIGNFRAGVLFNTTLPDVTDPFDLRSGEFSPMGEMSLEDWVNLLEQSVVNQYNSGAGGDFWGVFLQPMRIEGGATLFSAYTSQLVFRADIDIILSTDGKFLINARGVFADNLTLDFKLYANLSRLADGSGTILFLADMPAELPFMSIFGGLTFEFFRNDGLEVSEENQADGFRIVLTGGVVYSAAGFVDMTISGRVEIAFTPTLFSIDMEGSVNISMLGDAIGMAGKFRIDTSGPEIEVWGVMALQPNFGFLEEIGLYVDGLAVLRLNLTGEDRVETLNIPGTGERIFNLGRESLSLLVEGFVSFRLSGDEWFRMEGVFAMELTPQGFDVVLQGSLLIGQTSGTDPPFLTIGIDGFFAVRSNGVAGKFEVVLDTGFAAQFGITLRGSALIMFNTTGQTVSYELPEGLDEGLGDRNVSIPGAAPGSPGALAEPFFMVDVSGDIGLLDVLEMNGRFYMLISPSVIDVQISANFALAVAGQELFRFSAEGGMRIDSRGAAGVLDLQLAAGNNAYGLSFDAAFRLEFNTMAQSITLAGIQLRAGSYLEIVAEGNLVIAGLTLNGTFFFRQTPQDITLVITAAMNLNVGNTTLFGFSVGGGLNIGTAGTAGFLDLSISTNPGFMSLSGNFSLQINTRSTAVTLGSVTIPAGPNYFRLQLSGSVTILGVTMEGSFDFELTASYLRIDASASIALRVGNTDLFRFAVSGNLFIDGQGVAARIALGAPTTNASDSFGFNAPSNGFVLEINTRASETNLGGVVLPGGPFVQFALNASISILGVDFAGSFLFRQEGTQVTVMASASLQLRVGNTTFFSFNIDGALQISTAGIRAVVDASIGTGAPGTFGISTGNSTTFRLAINTGSAAFFGGMILPANYFAILGQGSISILGFSFEGSFSFIKTGSTYDLSLNAQMLLVVGGTNLFRLNVNSALRVATNGVAGRLSASLAGNNAAAFGFSISASFLLEINTTGSQQNIGGTIIQAGNYTRVLANGTLTVGGFRMVGDFTFTATTSSVSLSISAEMRIQIGNTVLFRFSISGGAFIDNRGIAARLNATLISGASGYSFSGSFIFQFNTRNLNTFVGGATVPANSAMLRVQGSLNIAGFTLNGTFQITAGQNMFEVSASASVSVFGATLSVSGNLGIYNNGIAASLNISSSLINNNFVRIQGNFSFQINTTSQTRFGIAANTVRIAITNASVRILGVNMSGSIFITFSSGQFRITIPANNALTVSLGNFLTVSVSGFISSNGQFSLTGSASLNIGTANRIRISGTASVTISNANGASGRFNGSLSIFNQNVASVNASIGLTASQFSFNANVQFNIPGGFARANGTVSVTAYSSYVRTTFSLNVRLFNSFNVSVSGNVDSRGSYSFTGSVRLNVGNSNLGANFNLSVTINNNGFTLRASGSAWAKFKVFGVSVGPTISFSGNINSNGRLDIWVGACVNIPIVGRKCAGVTVKISLKNGFSIWSSEVIGGIVFFDVNNNGVFDEGEPYAVIGEDGFVSFFRPEADTDVGERTLTLFEQLDTNGDGMLSFEEAPLYLVGGNRISDGSFNDETFALTEGALSGDTEFANASVFIDRNGNGILDDGDIVVTTDAEGHYDLLPILFPEAIQLDPVAYLGALAGFDRNGDGHITDDEGILRYTGGISLETGEELKESRRLEQVEGIGNIDYAGAMVFLDLNGNGIHDEGEPFTITDALGGFSFIEGAGFDPEHTLGELARFDRNNNGILDADEGQIVAIGGMLRDPETGEMNPVDYMIIENDLLVGYTPQEGATLVFFDANFNGVLDEGEVIALLDAEGFYTFIDLEATSVRPTGGLADFASGDNGLLSHGDGVFRFIGGTDATTGQALPAMLSVTAEDFGDGLHRSINPLTDLKAKLMDQGMEREEAELIVSLALGLREATDIDNVDPNTLAELDPTQVDNLFGAALKLDTVVLMAEALFRGMNPELGHFEVRTAIHASIAELLKQLNTELEDDQHILDENLNTIEGTAPLFDLETPENIRRVLELSAARLGLTLDDAVVAAFLQTVTDIVGEIKARIADNMEDPILGFAYIKSLVIADILPAATAVGSGQSPVELLENYQGDRLREHLARIDLTVPSAGPSIGVIDPQLALPGVPLEVHFTVTDPDDLDRDVRIVIESSHPELIAPDQVAVLVDGSKRTLVITPSGTISGDVVITVHAIDRHGLSDRTTFTVTVLPRVSLGGFEIIRDSQGVAQTIRFSVVLETPSDQFIRVAFSTRDLSAQGGIAFVPTAGLLEFAPGETVRYVDVALIPGRFTPEAEAFLFELFDPNGSIVSQTTAEIPSRILFTGPVEIRFVGFFFMSMDADSDEEGAVLPNIEVSMSAFVTRARTDTVDTSRSYAAGPLSATTGDSARFMDPASLEHAAKPAAMKGL